MKSRAGGCLRRGERSVRAALQGAKGDERSEQRTPDRSVLVEYI